MSERSARRLERIAVISMFLVAAPPIGTALPFTEPDPEWMPPGALATATREARAETAGPTRAPEPRRPDWDAIAACESSGDWSTNTGNGYWGGLQFLPDTWFEHGGGPFAGSGPFPYSPAEQIAVAERVLASQGPGAWPNCFAWR